MTAPPLLRAEGVSFAYGGDPVLDGVDLTVDAGEFAALVGPNGAGKSTLLRIALGLLAPQAGTVELFGQRPRQLRDRWRLGYVPQRPRFAPDLPATVEEVVAAGCLTRRGWRRGLTAGDRVDVAHALESVALSERAGDPLRELSGGQQQRVLIAKALVSRPELLVLDEPSSNLDPASRRELADIIRSLDVTVLMVTHDLPYAYELCPRSVVLSDGVVVADGPTREVLTDDALMAAHRLELPFGFDPRTVPAP